MFIKRIEIKNFKSFKDLTIDLNNFNVLIGANASGKSNFVNAFRFLRDIMNSGLENAISLQGGVEYLRNLNVGASKNLCFKVVSEISAYRVHRVKNKDVFIHMEEVIYEFELGFNKRGAGFRLITDRLTQMLEFGEWDRQEKKPRAFWGKGEVVFSRANGRKNGKIDVQYQIPDSIPISEDVIYPGFITREKLPEKTLFLETPFFAYILMPSLEKNFTEIAFYDFDPRLPKKATPITGKAELEEDGSNLSIILRNLLKDKETKQKLFRLINELLPFVSDLAIERFADKSLLFKLKEKYFVNQYLPASLISDGTINVTAVLIALFFERKPFIIVEEPERNIHPYLISKLVNLMLDASRHKQILITTHNPEFVKHTPLENILLIARDDEGFSTINRPIEKKTIQTFLSNNIGVDELFVQNLLELKE